MKNTKKNTTALSLPSPRAFFASLFTAPVYASPLKERLNVSMATSLNSLDLLNVVIVKSDFPSRNRSNLFSGSLL